MGKLLLIWTILLSWGFLATADAADLSSEEQRDLFEAAKRSFYMKHRSNEKSGFMKSVESHNVTSISQIVEALTRKKDPDEFSTYAKDLIGLIYSNDDDDFDESVEHLLGYIKNNFQKLSLQDDYVYILFLKNLSMYSPDLFEQHENSIAEYFNVKINFLFEEENSEKINPEEVFYNYSILNLILEEDATFTKVVEPIIKVVILNSQSNKNEVAAYKRVLKSKMYSKNNLAITDNILDSMENLASHSIKKISAKKVNLKTVYENIDLYVTLFDRPLDNLVDYKKSTWIERLDVRAEILYNLWLTLKSDGGAILSQSFDGDAKGPAFPKHPLAQIYALRAYIETSEKIGVFDIPGEYKLEQGSDYFNKVIKREFRGRTSGESVLRKYTDAFNQVELKRFLLEAQAIYPTVLSEPRKERLRIKTYEEMRDQLVIANNIRYDKNFTFLNLQYYKETNFGSLKAEDVVSDEKKYKLIEFCKLEADCGEKFVPAGIYRSRVKRLKIEGDIIRFHPLAMIHIPGGFIKINANEVINPWIDVSGKMFHPKLKATKVETQRRRTHLNGDPRRQLSGGNGGRGGGVLININRPSFLPLYNAMGADGGIGFEGTSARDCKNGVYEGDDEYRYYSGRRGYGGHGGNAGAGGKIKFVEVRSTLKKSYQANFFVNAGRRGMGGAAGPCGHPDEPFNEMVGDRGEKASPGKIIYQ